MASAKRALLAGLALLGGTVVEAQQQATARPKPTNWLAGAGDALQGLVSSVTGTDVASGAFGQCAELPALFSKLSTEEYASCPMSQKDQIPMMMWYMKQQVSHASPMSIPGMRTSQDEDKRMSKLMHKQMQEACGSQKCQALQMELANVSMGCYMGGICHTIEMQKSQDPELREAIKLTEQQCINVLRKSTMSSIFEFMDVGCDHEEGKAGAEDKNCMEVYELDLMAYNPMCYAGMAQLPPECTESCRPQWQNLTAAYPKCTKRIDEMIMHQKQNQLKLASDLTGERIEMPMMTYTEVCNRQAGLGTGASVNVQI
mmetsp:Transcript_20862/g.48355  ORF Transcript_20862/g.48355 Transcript_20862/m.48355 type:complete len:315 (+) Transcript_20862:95-1039(+)